MRLGIYGYGNVGKAVLDAALKSPDFTPAAIFSRRGRSARTNETTVPVYPAGDVLSFRGKIDILMLCTGSATDLPRDTPRLARYFSVVDSFDTHGTAAEHFALTDRAAKAGGNAALLCAGWDPGIFSVCRAALSAFFPDAAPVTFWGPGVSQGHSDALRRLPGVLDARAYTVPREDCLRAAEAGRLTGAGADSRKTHRRVCYVVPSPDADREELRRRITEMPHYFSGYDVSVNFITQEEMRRSHTALPHGGKVTVKGHGGAAAFSLSLPSNPAFTGQVLIAGARAIFRKFSRGERGAFTFFDLSPADLSPLSPDELRRKFL